jgi:hypothetical protein
VHFGTVAFEFRFQAGAIFQEKLHQTVENDAKKGAKHAPFHGFRKRRIRGELERSY